MSWLCALLRQGAGAGCWCSCWVLQIDLSVNEKQVLQRVARGGGTVPVLGAGSVRGRDSGRRCRCCELAVRAVPVHLVETGCRVLSAGCWVPGGGGGYAGAGRWCWAPWCWCCGPGCWCCGLAERAFKTGGHWRRCRCCQLAKRTGAGVS